MVGEDELRQCRARHPLVERRGLSITSDHEVHYFESQRKHDRYCAHDEWHGSPASSENCALS